MQPARDHGAFIVFFNQESTGTGCGHVVSMPGREHQILEFNPCLKLRFFQLLLSVLRIPTCCHELSIYIHVSISSTPCPLTGTSSKGMAPRQSCLQVSLFRHSLSAYYKALPPTLSIQYSSTLFIHFTGGRPLTPLPSIVLSYMYPLCKVTFIHSHHMSIPSQCASLHPFNHSAVHSRCCFTHTKPPIHVLITLSIPP